MKTSELQGGRVSSVRCMEPSRLRSYDETPGGARPGQSNVHGRLGLGSRSSKKKPERQEGSGGKRMDGERESDLDPQSGVKPGSDLDPASDLHIKISDLFPKEEHPRGEAARPGLGRGLRIGLGVGLRWSRRWGAVRRG